MNSLCRGGDRSADRDGPRAHHPALDERFAAAPPPPEDPTPLAAMAHRLKTPEGRKLYALRKHTPEPVFGIIKSVRSGSASSCCVGSTTFAASGTS